MAITDSEPPMVTELTLLDEAVIDYNVMGQDFIQILDAYVNAFAHAKRYTFFGPDYILLGQEETRVNPLDPESELTDPYWYVVYAASKKKDTCALFLELMPYPLDRVGFSRYAKYPERGVRFIPVKTIQRLYDYGRISTKTSHSSTTSTTSTTSCADSESSDQTGKGSRESGEPDDHSAQTGQASSRAASHRHEEELAR